MRIKSFYVPLIAGTIFFIACSRKNTVSLSYTNAKEEVPQLGNLTFRFSQSLVKDSMLNTWDSTEYISFEPEIPGRFRWESPDQLVFSPSQPLSPATNYTASVKKTVLKYSKYSSVSDGDKISFYTPPLTLDNSQVLWTGEGGTSVAPQIDLFFNYRINPEDLKGKLKVEVEGNKADLTFITASTDNKISVRINGLKQEDKDLAAIITIEKGLKPESGKNATTEALKSNMQIPSPFVLTIQSVEAEHDGTEGVVRVTTSQQLSNAGLKQFIKFDPSLDFTVQLTENGFELRSDKFDVERSYALSINSGLRGNIGGVLKEAYNGSVAFGELEAGISFTNSKAVYLSKKGGKNIEVRLTNVPKVKLVISKIYENNLLLAQRYGYYPQESKARYASYGEDSDEGYDDDYYGNNTILGDVIYEKEIDTRTLPKSGAGRLLNFSQFEDRLPDFKGVYHVVIRSTEEYWVRDSRFISLSDLGLIAKEGEDKLYVFANSIKTASSLGGVNVSVYANNNQLIGSAPTNSEGIAEIAYTKKEYSGFRPAMVIAKTDDDFNYLPFNNTRTNVSRFDVGGKRNNPSGLDAFVYAERDIYRPGEKVNFSVVVRDRDWKNPGDVPLKMKFLLPNGKELKLIRKTLNEEGSVEGSIDIAASAITGSYTLEVYTSNDVLLASKNFSIEEFVPDRIRINTKLDKTFLRPGESTNLSVNAMNFFGPPAANRNYETEIQLKQKYFSPEKFADYDFSLSSTTSLLEKIVREGKTDEQGNAAVTFDMPATYANNGVLQANFYTTVFDETGRPVSKGASIDVFTQDVMFGMKRDWYYYYPLNQAVKFQLAAVNKDGNASNGTARVEVIKKEYKTVLVRSGSYFRYESQEDEKVMIESQVNVGANTVYSYVPRSPGNYEVRLYRPGAASYVKREFYSYGSWGMTNNSFEVNTEGNIDIELDKKSYFSGETVKALFKTPFSGRMLVTMETDHVISYQYVDVSNRTASLDLKLDGQHVPNVYITATLIKPHEVSDIPLTVANGFQNVKVEEKSRKIPVEIEAQKNVRSKTKQKVTVKATPGSYVTLSAVDNGVLQVTDFKTPDPYNYFYQKKALQVY
ncbi:MAG TPA: MG2 domain-containing protein, partial [Chitinophagaceae bacterium]